MMLETDMALVKDKAFRPIAEKYAKDEQAFFSDFSKAFGKLIEVRSQLAIALTCRAAVRRVLIVPADLRSGVPDKNFSSPPLTLKTTSELAA